MFESFFLALMLSLGGPQAAETPQLGDVIEASGAIIIADINP